MHTAALQLRLLVIYKYPSDFPNDYVSRFHRVGPGGQYAIDALPVTIATSLEAVREYPQAAGMRNLGRNAENDDPTIVEVWI